MMRTIARGPIAFTGAMLALATGLAWITLFVAMPGAASAVGFLAAWLVMMAAMMLPSAAPMVLLYRLSADRARGDLRTLLFAASYLAVWTAVGLAAYALQLALGAILTAEARTLAIAAILVAAGAYQFTPLKAACLRVCRSPADFLVQHWRGGAAGAVRLGVEHGIYCLGCCWALMAVLVAAGGMGLAWVVAIAAVVFAEKLLPRAPAFGRSVGLALVSAGLAVVLAPDLAMRMSGGM